MCLPCHSVPSLTILSPVLRGCVTMHKRVITTAHIHTEPPLATSSRMESSISYLTED
jgi:hypothetical protein